MERPDVRGVDTVSSGFLAAIPKCLRTRIPRVEPAPTGSAVLSRRRDGFIWTGRQELLSDFVFFPLNAHTLFTAYLRVLHNRVAISSPVFSRRQLWTGWSHPTYPIREGGKRIVRTRLVADHRLPIMRSPLLSGVPEFLRVDPVALDLVTAVREAFGDQACLETLRRVSLPKTERDDSVRILVSDQGGLPLGILFRSPSMYPQFAQRIANRTRLAKAALPEALGRHVVSVLAVGESSGLTYVALPVLEPLRMSGPVWFLQRHFLRPVLLKWLREVTRATVKLPSREEIESGFARPLARLAECEAMPAHVRRGAERAADRIAKGLWIPRHVLTHTDFWQGNLLLPGEWRIHRFGSSDFVVIDWAGAVVCGYGFVDLVRFSRSFRVHRARFKREVAEHCKLVECAPEDACGAYLAFAGYMLDRLEEFPLHRHVAQVESCYSHLTECLG